MKDVYEYEPNDPGRKNAPGRPDTSDAAAKEATDTEARAIAPLPYWVEPEA